MLKKLGKKGIIILLLSWATTALGQTRFSADTDARSVAMGAVFEVRFTLTNANGSNFRPPTLSDFNIMSGVQRTFSSTTINGVSATSETYSMLLQGKKEGKWTIGAASIQINGQTLSTQPLNVVVTKANTRLKNTQESVFISAEASKTTARMGEQITIDYKLFTRVNLNSANVLSEPKYEGFYKKDVNDFPRGDVRLSQNGRTYIVRTIRRVALFPQKEGLLTVEPLSLQVGLVQQNSDGMGGFFDIPTVEQAFISANNLTINVLPLGNLPASFSGAVGRFRAGFEWDKNQGSTDDVFILRLGIEGNGDPKRWQAPPLTTFEGFDSTALVVYEPKLIKEESIEQQGEWVTTKTYEYLVAAKKAGRFELKPAFFYVDTEGGGLKKAHSDTILTLLVQQGHKTTADLLTDAPLKDVHPIALKAQVYAPDSLVLGSLGFNILCVLPFLGLGGIVAYKRHLHRLSQVDIKVLKEKNASKEAERRLELAYEFLGKGHTRLFYDEVSKALFTYLSDKINMPLSAFSKSAVREKLNDLSVNPLYIDDFMNVLRDCELALFAGQSADNMTTSYQQALNVIMRIEEDLNKR